MLCKFYEFMNFVVGVVGPLIIWNFSGFVGNEIKYIS